MNTLLHGKDSAFFLHMHKSHGSATAINLSMLFNNEQSMFKRLRILSLFHTTISYHLVLVSSCRLHILVFLFNPYPQFYHLPHLYHHHLQFEQQLSYQNIHIPQEGQERCCHLSEGEICNLCRLHTLQLCILHLK